MLTYVEKQKALVLNQVLVAFMIRSFENRLVHKFKQVRRDIDITINTLMFGGNELVSKHEKIRPNQDLFSEISERRLFRNVIGSVLCKKDTPKMDADGFRTDASAIAAVNTLTKFWREIQLSIPSNKSSNEEESGSRGFIRAGGKNVYCPISKAMIPIERVFKVYENGVCCTAYDIIYLGRALQCEHSLTDGNTYRYKCPVSRVRLYHGTIDRLGMKRVKYFLAVQHAIDLKKERENDESKSE